MTPVRADVQLRRAQVAAPVGIFAYSPGATVVLNNAEYVLQVRWHGAGPARTGLGWSGLLHLEHAEQWSCSGQLPSMHAESPMHACRITHACMPNHPSMHVRR